MKIEGPTSFLPRKDAGEDEREGLCVLCVLCGENLFFVLFVFFV
jgi:hypothetical protein